MFDWLKNIQNKIKDLNISVEQYKKETENQVLPTKAYINRAKKFMDKGLFFDAGNILKEALTISEKDALVYKYLAICEENLGNYSYAIDMYQKSAQLNPQDKKIWYKLGMLQINLKLFEDAEKSFEQAHKITPVNTDVQTGWGMTLLKQKKYLQAHEKFITALKYNSHNFSAMLLAAIVEVKIEKYNDAEKKLEFLMKKNPTEGASYEYACLYKIKNNYEKAISYCEKSIKLNPNMLPAHLLLGEIYSCKFDYESTVKSFENAEKLELTSPLLYVTWANALANMGYFEEAKQQCQTALLKDFNDFDAQALMALCCAETKDFEKMHDFIKYIEEKNIQDIAIDEAKGLFELACDNIDNAITIFKNALVQHPERILNYYRLAKCYEKLNNVDMTKDSYDKLLNHYNNFANGYLDYAKYLIKIDDYKGAQRKLRKVEKFAPHNQEVLNLLFFTCYILVKDNLCEYNIKEAISIADRIENFEYPEQKRELEKLLEEIKQ